MNMINILLLRLFFRLHHEWIVYLNFLWNQVSIPNFYSFLEDIVGNATIFLLQCV